MRGEKNNKYKLHLYKDKDKLSLVCSKLQNHPHSMASSITLVLRISLIKKKPKAVKAQLEYEFPESLKIKCRCCRTDVAQLVMCDWPKINTHKQEVILLC